MGTALRQAGCRRHGGEALSPLGGEAQRSRERRDLDRAGGPPGRLRTAWASTGWRLSALAAALTRSSLKRSSEGDRAAVAAPRCRGRRGSPPLEPPPWGIGRHYVPPSPQGSNASEAPEGLGAPRAPTGARGDTTAGVRPLGRGGNAREAVHPWERSDQAGRGRASWRPRIVDFGPVRAPQDRPRRRGDPERVLLPALLDDLPLKRAAPGVHDRGALAGL